MSEQDVFDALKYRVEVAKDGTRIYYNNAGELHRDEGPAVEWDDGTKIWYQNGQLHRIDGPAIDYASGPKAWYINGVRLTEAEFLIASQPVVEMTVADVEKLVGKHAKIIK